MKPYETGVERGGGYAAMTRRHDELTVRSDAISAENLIRNKGGDFMNRLVRSILRIGCILGIAVSSVGDPSFGQNQEMFNILCNPPFIDESGGEVNGDEFCKTIVTQFEEQLGQKLGISINMELVFEKEGFQRIISQLGGSFEQFDVWIGGEEYFHQLGTEKGLLAQTMKISREKWNVDLFWISIINETRNYKIASIFIDWIHYAEIEILNK